MKSGEWGACVGVVLLGGARGRRACVDSIRGNLRFFQAWIFGFLLDFMMDFELDRLLSHLPSFLQLEVPLGIELAGGSVFACMHACVMWADCGLSQGAW